MTPPLQSIISRLHLKQLRLLVALAEHGSLLKASQQVALTQPGASKALQEIETTFGSPLFVRTNRGLEPNAVGHCVIRYARLIQTDLAHLRDEIVGIMRGQGGRVAAGVIMGAVPLLTDAISALVARQADLSVEIVEDTSAELLARLDAGRLDLAICRTTAQAHGGEVDAGGVARNHACVFELLHALAHRGLRQADLFAQRRQALTRVVLQGREDLPVFFVQFHCSVSFVFCDDFKVWEGDFRWVPLAEAAAVSYRWRAVMDLL